MVDRHPFGGGIADWVFTKNADDIPVFAGGAVLQFWNQRVDGTQYTDITQDVDGNVPIVSLLSSDGTDGYEIGDVPSFWGPPDVTIMWLSADGGVRHAIASRDAADLAGAAITGLSQHVSQQNPHGTTIDVLSDTTIPDTRVDGSFLAWDEATAKFVLVSGTGLNPADFVGTGGGSTIRIPDNNTALFAQEIRIPSGDRTSAPDAFRVWLNVGSNGTPSWIETIWASAYGDFRAQASADNRVAAKIHRRSSGATADILQIADQAGTPLAWFTANGSLRSPSVGRSIFFTKAGTVTTGTGKFAYTNMTGVSQTLRALLLRFDTAASSGTSTFDINLNGTTLYPTGKPTIASGSTTTGIIAAAFTIPAAGVLTVDVDAIGAGASDLGAQIEVV